MSMVRIYLYGVNQSVVVPVMGRTEDGMLVEIEPVKLFEVSDVNSWKTFVLELLARGPKEIKAKDQSTNPGSAILDKLNLERWSDFERYAVMYILHKGPKFISVYSTGKTEDGMWTQGKSHRTFHPRAPLDIVVSEMVGDILKEPEALKKEPKLLLG